MYDFISEFESKLINKSSDRIYKLTDSNNDIFSKDELCELQMQIAHSATKYEMCSAIESLHYCYSMLLTKIRQTKRAVLTEIFHLYPKIMEEKSVLEKKLDSFPEYARYKETEEYIFQFLNHLKEIKDIVIWQFKEE